MSFSESHARASPNQATFGDLRHGQMSKRGSCFRLVRLGRTRDSGIAQAIRELGRVLTLVVTLTLGILVGPITAGAQQMAKVPRIGVLYSGGPTTSSHTAAAFEQSLREHGYVEGGGLLFADRAELEAAIRSLTSDAARRDAMADAAHRAFRTNWSETVALTTYFDLIRSVAAGRGLHAVSDAFPTPADIRA
jgi:hypothetical protein